MGKRTSGGYGLHSPKVRAILMQIATGPNSVCGLASRHGAVRDVNLRGLIEYIDRQAQLYRDSAEFGSLNDARYLEKLATAIKSGKYLRRFVLSPRAYYVFPWVDWDSSAAAACYRDSLGTEMLDGAHGCGIWDVYYVHGDNAYSYAAGFFSPQSAWGHVRDMVKKYGVPDRVYAFRLVNRETKDESDDTVRLDGATGRCIKGKGRSVYRKTTVTRGNGTAAFVGDQE